MKKTLTKIILLTATALCSQAQTRHIPAMQVLTNAPNALTHPFQLSFTPSPSDTNPAPDGLYFVTGLLTNAPDPTVQVPLAGALTANVGQTNGSYFFMLDAAQLPAPRCYLYVGFSNSIGCAESTPFMFCSNDFFAMPVAPPQTNQPPGPPHPVPPRH